MPDDDNHKKKSDNGEDLTNLKKALESERTLRKQAERDAAAARQEYLRMQVATDKGLTPKQARRLQGSTREELERDADDLIEHFGIKKKSEDVKSEDTGKTEGEKPSEDDTKPEDGKSSGDDEETSPFARKRQPKERLVSGGAGSTSSDQRSMKEIADQVLSDTLI